MLIFSAIAILWVDLTKPKIKNLNDLYFIKGHFRDYDFDKHGGRYTIYNFRLKEYSKNLKIKADFLSDFEKGKFMKLQYGDDLVISIAQNDTTCLKNNDGFLFVYSIHNNENIFLDPNFTIKKHNSIFMYYSSSFFIIVGFILIYFVQKMKSKNLPLLD